MIVAGLRWSWEAISGADAPVASRLRISPSRGRQRALLSATALLQLTRHAAERLGRQHRAALRDRADRIADLAAVGVLRDVSGRTEAQAFVDVVALGVDGQDEHRARQPALLVGELGQDRVRGQPRHPQVEHRDVRLRVPDALQRLLPVPGGRDELEIPGALNRRRQPVEVDRMVVGDEYPRCIAHHSGF